MGQYGYKKIRILYGDYKNVSLPKCQIAHKKLLVFKEYLL
jgi:hypothetical protein